MDIFEKFFIFWIALVLMVAVFLIADALHIPMAEENARKECLALGYDQAKDFSRLPFSTEPLGLKCEYAGYNVDLTKKEG